MQCSVRYLDDAMEDDPIVVSALRQCPKVVASLWRVVPVQLNLHVAHRRAEFHIALLHHRTVIPGA